MGAGRERTTAHRPGLKLPIAHFSWPQQNFLAVACEDGNPEPLPLRCSGGSRRRQAGALVPGEMHGASAGLNIELRHNLRN